MYLSFLSSRISLILLSLLVLSISLSHIVPYNILQQQALAQTKKRTDNTDATPGDKTGENNSENFATYKNPAFGINIQYPFNWEKIEEDEDQDSSERQVVKFIPQMKDHSTKYPSFIISIHTMHHNNIKDFFRLFDKPTSDAISLRGFVLSHLTSLSTKLLDFRFIKPESYETTLAGNNVAQKIVYTYREGQEDAATSKVMEVLMIKDDRGYIISYHADSSNYLYYLLTIQKMIDSFELTK